MLGSLDLLFNPTGLLQSLGQAWGTLLLGPLAAIEARSPTQVRPTAFHTSPLINLMRVFAQVSTSLKKMFLIFTSPQDQ